MNAQRLSADGTRVAFCTDAGAFIAVRATGAVSRISDRRCTAIAWASPLDVIVSNGRTTRFDLSGPTPIETIWATTFESEDFAMGTLIGQSSTRFEMEVRSCSL